MELYAAIPRTSNGTIKRYINQPSNRLSSGSVSECEQVERLVKSLMINMDIDSNVKTVLTEIYEYSQTGIGAADLEAHITTHQNDLSQWVDDIDQY